MESNNFKIIDSNELHNDPDWVRAATQRLSLLEETAQILIGARIKMGLTQSQLAKDANTTQSVIARAESGRHLLSLSLIERIAKAYKTNARILFESMPEVVPVSVKYANELSIKREYWNMTLTPLGKIVISSSVLSNTQSLPVTQAINN